MERKTKLTQALDEWLKRIDQFDSWFAPEHRTSSGDFETWGPKDFIAHSAEWTHRQVAIFRDPSNVATFEGMDEVNEFNRMHFDRYQATGWDDVVERLRSSVSELHAELDSRSEEDLAADDTFANDGNGVWRGFAFYGVLHSVSHIAEALVRAGRPETAVELQHDTTSWLEELDEGERWQGMVGINLARVLALAGDDEATESARRAVSLVPRAKRWIERDSAFDGVRDAVLG